MSSLAAVLECSQTSNGLEDFVGFDVVCAHLGISRRYATQLAVEGVLPSYVLGGRRVFLLSEGHRTVKSGRWRKTNRGRPKGERQPKHDS